MSRLERRYEAVNMQRTLKVNKAVDPVQFKNDQREQVTKIYWGKKFTIRFWSINAILIGRENGTQAKGLILWPSSCECLRTLYFLVDVSSRSYRRDTGCLKQLISKLWCVGLSLLLILFSWSACGYVTELLGKKHRFWW